MTEFYYFSTNWCAPCKTFKPIVQQVCAENQIPVQFIDAQQQPELAARFGVSSVPTIVVAQNGQVQFKHTGVMPKPILESKLNAFR